MTLSTRSRTQPRTPMDTAHAAPRLRDLAAFIALALLAGACQAVGSGTAAPDVAAGAAADESVDSAAKLADKRSEVELAELALELAEFDAETAEFQARLEREHARRELAVTRRALEQFEEVESEHRRAKAMLDLDRTRYRAEEAEAELVELERMYEKEEFAELTKELVLQRGRRALETARRDLELRERELQMLEEYQLPKEHDALEHERSLAGEKVEATARTIRRVTLDGRRKCAEAEGKLERLRRELAELEPAVERGEDESVEAAQDAAQDEAEGGVGG